VPVLGFGIEGAAIATALTLIGWYAAMGFFVWRRLGIVPGVSAGLRGASVPRVVSQCAPERPESGRTSPL
jgi:hypothetical protein